MPLTPHGSPGDPLSSMSPGVGLLVGGLLAALGIALGLRSPLQGLAVGGFGLTLVAWGQLMRDGPGSPLANRLWLALGAVAALTAFVCSFLLLR